MKSYGQVLYELYRAEGNERRQRLALAAGFDGIGISPEIKIGDVWTNLNEVQRELWDALAQKFLQEVGHGG